jgi:hypothetical protein
MDQLKVANFDLLTAGLSLMEAAGKPLTEVRSGSRAKLFRTPDEQTVRVRTCNDHVLVIVADTTEPSAKLNIEGTDLLLIVMPQVARRGGAVMAFLVPTKVAADAARSTHAQWLAANPATKGRNKTWNLWFDDDAPSKASGYARLWEKYRLAGSAISNPAAPAPESADAKPQSLGEVIAEARRKIAAAAGVPETAIKISVDLG